MEWLILAVVIVLAFVYFRSVGRHLDRMADNYGEGKEDPEKKEVDHESQDE